MTPTLDALAVRFFPHLPLPEGRQMVRELLDTLDNDTLRQARIEHHHGESPRRPLPAPGLTRAGTA